MKKIFVFALVAMMGLAMTSCKKSADKIVAEIEKAESMEDLMKIGEKYGDEKFSEADQAKLEEAMQKKVSELMGLDELVGAAQELSDVAEEVGVDTEELDEAVEELEEAMEE